ncbi:hypothetical protein EV174_002372 [Coemansia sp. RSA 2320]|nr:hypothetical protein EV174_002372 [Coemansia sp. RSA 2320]
MMEHTDSEAARVLDVLQGAAAGERQAKVWTAPAGVGSDLARASTAAAVVGQWAELTEAQKINSLLGIAHVGQSKMQAARGEVQRLAQLARSDGGSDWVRVLGHTLGDVGTTGRLARLDALPHDACAELHDAAARLEAAASKCLPGLCVPGEVLACVAPAVADATAPRAVCNAYGARPSDALVARVRAAAAGRRPATPRHASAGATSRRPSAIGPPSAPLSPEPSVVLDGLFGGSDSEGDSDDEALPPAVMPAVRASHRADHVGRMERLLAAAEVPALQGVVPQGDVRRPSLGVVTGASSGSSGRVSAPAAAAPSKIGMFAPRRRAAPSNTALPSGARRGPDSTAKKIQVVDFHDAQMAINARERELQERRDRVAEEREAKRAKCQADIDERKRLRAEAAERKRAAAEERAASATPRRPRGRPRTSGPTSPNDSDSARPESPDGAAFDPPMEYLTFAGNDPQIRAVYTHTNALSDVDRLRLYCFFNSRPMPPGTPPRLDIVLNEQTIPDPANPASTCREIMVLQADLALSEWKKVRRLRRGD